MKKVRTFINVALGSMIAALGLSSCGAPMVKYGVPEDPVVDSTMQVMYGVSVVIDDPDSANE